jgi:transposase
MMTKQMLEKQNRDLRLQLSNFTVSRQMSEDALNEKIAVFSKELIAKDKQIRMLQAYIAGCELKIDNLTTETANLLEENVKLSDKNARLRNNVDTLKVRINKDSSNSSKPPSTDGFKKPRTVSLRKRSGKKLGGQPGHAGHTLGLFAQPTEVVEKRVAACGCGGEVVCNGYYDAKQIVDINVTVSVVEERAMKGWCSRCGKFHQGEFSDKYINKVQYGDGIKSLALLLSERGFVPINRTAEIINSLSGGFFHISDGTIANMQADFANGLGETINTILNGLTGCRVLNADETGCKVDGKLNWVQVFSDKLYTLYGHNAKRGSLSVEDMKILDNFVGTLVHDHFAPYYKYDLAMHAECNAHILRYLKGITEIHGHKWAADMAELLTAANNYKKECVVAGITVADPEKLIEIATQYDTILTDGRGEYDEATKGKKQIAYYNEERLLIKRLGKFKNEHLRFLTDFDVPFDNNGAERDVRMFKGKLKVSGGFRSKDGAKNFAKIASVLSTARKHKLNLYDTIKELLVGINPIPEALG